MWFINIIQCTCCSCKNIILKVPMRAWYCKEFGLKSYVIRWAEMLFRKKGYYRVSLSCVYRFKKSLKDFDKVNRPFLIIWDDFDGRRSYLELWGQLLCFWACHYYTWTLHDLTSLPSSGLVVGFNDSRVIGRKIHNKIWRSCGNNLYILEFEMLNMCPDKDMTGMGKGLDSDTFRGR